MREEYEYVVVGSGAGGGPVAANLARAGHTVLLLEAGGASGPEDYEYAVPAFHTLASEKEEMAWQFFVRHYDDEAQQRRDSKLCPQEGGVFYPRAASLGGCTAHNAMILLYPSNSDWNGIAAITGDPSWSAANMRRYFERLERCRYRPLHRLMQWLWGPNPSRHGFAGWLSTEEADPGLAVHDQKLLGIIKRSAWKAFTSLRNPVAWLKILFKTALDPNDWRATRKRAEGIYLVPVSTREGRRVGTRELLLEVQKQRPDKLTIKTGALATRVLLDDDQRAVGVEFLEGRHLYAADPRYREDSPRVLRQVTARCEVILAGGAFNTPQLLQLSGIGPAALLERCGIPVRVDLPGVGANLQDRYEVSVVTRMKKPFRLLEGAVMRPPLPGEQPDPYLRRWRDEGKGIYTTNGTVISILKKSRASRPDPDLFLFGLVTNFRGYYPGYSATVSRSHQYLTWAILKGHTRNTAGRVAIRSGNPRQVPDIDFNYFDPASDPSGEDLEAVVGAVEFVRGMTSQYGDVVDREEVPGPQVRTRDQIRQFVRDEAWGHHASCTCKIGPPNDRMAVLDSKFRVYGTKGLRVVDASVFPRIPGLFIVSAVYMVAEKASDVILSEGASQGDDR